jgi:hypothetical protein
VLYVYLRYKINTLFYGKTYKLTDMRYAKPVSNDSFHRPKEMRYFLVDHHFSNSWISISLATNVLLFFAVDVIFGS